METINNCVENELAITGAAMSNIKYFSQEIMIDQLNNEQ